MRSKTLTIQNLFIAIAFILFFSGTTCRKDLHCVHDKLKIVNNSNIAVNWIIDDSIYSDTIWINNGDYPDASWGLLLPGSSYDDGNWQCWENVRGDQYQYYFIFSNDTVQAIGWQAISGTNRGLLKRVRIDSNYLNSNNYSLKYP